MSLGPSGNTAAGPRQRPDIGIVTKNNISMPILVYFIIGNYDNDLYDKVKLIFMVFNSLLSELLWSNN